VWVSARRTALLTGLVALSIALALSFALYTDQVWEDFLISLRHSANLIEGHGLTYEPGERVQGFSSPLAVLVGAGAGYLAGTDCDALDRAVWLYRAVGIAAHGLALLLLLLACTRGSQARGLWSLAVVGALYCLESKTLAFATNGMETPFFLLFAAGSLWAMARGPTANALLLGAFWGGLLWTRPDGSVYIALMGLAVLLFPSVEARSARLRGLLIAAGICAAIYLPWLCFSWLYYGTPVPLAVQAKGSVAAGLAELDLATIWAALTRLLLLVYLPPYAEFGGWSTFEVPSAVMCMVAVLYWLVPGGAPLARRASFTAFGGLFYLFLIRPSWPWYLPVVFLFSLPVWHALLESLERRCSGGRPVARGLALGASAAVLGLFAFLAADYARVAHHTTSINEQGNRRELGSWLRETAEPADRVFLECPGYIGFYSGLKMLDFPGVVSPEVVRFGREGRPLMARAGLELAPEWLVLRPNELQHFERYDAARLHAQYRRVRVFDRRGELLAALPDHPATTYDSTFIVLRRR
jgi:hypothetical protein